MGLVVLKVGYFLLYLASFLGHWYTSSLPMFMIGLVTSVSRHRFSSFMPSWSYSASSYLHLFSSRPSIKAFITLGYFLLVTDYYFIILCYPLCSFSYRSYSSIAYMCSSRSGWSILLLFIFLIILNSLVICVGL